MGIHGLSKLLNDNAPRCVKEHKMDYFAGRKIAVDASMQIYQFLIAVRQAGGEGQLTNEAGEVTSHLTGMLYRTIRMMEAGIKPVFVFDGKAPTMKSGERAKRKERQQAAVVELAKLQEEGGTAEDIEKQQKRIVRASREQSEEVGALLLMRMRVTVPCLPRCSLSPHPRCSPCSLPCRSRRCLLSWESPSLMRPARQKQHVLHWPRQILCTLPLPKIWTR